MSDRWSSDSDGHFIEGPYWGARVWNDLDEEVWLWEAWSEGDETRGVRGDNAEGETPSRGKAMQKAEHWLQKLGVDLDDRY